MAISKKSAKLTARQCTARLSAVGDALSAIGGKWRLRIIIALLQGSLRFNDLRRTVAGISAKVLSDELKELEQNGFIRRTVFTGKPVIIEYELTGYSNTLQDVLQALSAWGTMHRATIRKRQRSSTRL